MSDKVDLSLDDIIKQSGNKFSYRGRGSFRGRGTYRGGFRPYNAFNSSRGGIQKSYQTFGVDFNVII